MTSVHETAYPRLKPDISEQELVSIYTPKRRELEFVTEQYRQVTQRVVLMVQLKLLQRLGYFMPLASVPKEIIGHICDHVGWRMPPSAALVKYDQSGSKSINQKRLRDFVGIRAMDAEAEQWIAEQAHQAAQTKQELPDIINVLVEELVQRRFELPGFTYLFRLAREARTSVNDAIYKRVAGGLSHEITTRLDQMLRFVQGKSIWDGLKREPKQPNVREVANFLKHIEAIRELAQGLPETDFIPAIKREYLTLEARALDVAEMNKLKPVKRYTLAILLIQTQVEKALDDVAEIFIKSVRNLHNIAEERLRQYHISQAEQVERLVGRFRDVLTVLSEDGTAAERVTKVEQTLDGDLENWISECDEHMAYAGKNYFPFMLANYGVKRSLLFKCLDVMALRSSSQDESLLDAVGVIQQYRSSHKEHLPVDEAGLEDLHLDWMPEKWRSLVFGRSAVTMPTHAHRKYFELAVFSAVMDDLKSGDLYVEHSGLHDDWRNHLVSWEEYEAEVENYGELVGLPTDPGAFTAALRADLSNLAREVDKRFPENALVDIDESGLVIRRNEKLKPPPELEIVDQHLVGCNR